MDIIQSLIILPLEEHRYAEIDVSYKTFVQEFVKIENEIGNPFYNLYILKGIVDVAREIRSDYLSNSKRDKALKYFRTSVYERINYVANYCKPKDVHFEKMLCSLLCLAKCMEGVLYDIISTRMKKKEKEYSKLPIQNIEQMYAAIETNIPDKYVFNKDTIVIAIDCINNRSSVFELSNEQTININGVHSLSKGRFLYDIYRK